MTTPQIGSAKAEDIPALVRLLGTLFTLEQDMRPDPERQARGLALLLNDPRRAFIVVARDERQEAVAMASAQLVVSTAEGGLSAWIEDVVVAQDYRGLGLGRALLSALLHWAKTQGASRAQLLVDNDNHPAWAFYERLGWQAMHMSARRIFLTR